MADIQVYKRVIDYVGLNAKPIPERSLALFRELSPTLALLQGMGSDGAKLVSVDANGNLQVSLAGSVLTSDVRVIGSAGSPVSVFGGNADNVAPALVLFTAGLVELYNGANFDRQRDASAANLATQNGLGVALAEGAGQWAVPSAPVAGNQATASRAAGGVGVRHVCKSISFAASSIVAPALTSLGVVLRDGTTGAGTILMSFTVAILAATGNNVPPVTLSGLNIIGSANTAMTLEFGAALANLSESVALTGYSVS